MAVQYENYLRMEKMPHIFCPGCGHGIVMKSFLRVVDQLRLDKDKVVVVSGIGCASRIPGYVDFNTLHTTHGRALAFATGIKLARPELKVVVLSGDGDAIAIGGNHFIHACRRNLDLTLIVLNNYIYGMTGGQRSPTTPKDSYASTAPYGSLDPAFDIAELAAASGATYVARTTEYHVLEISKYIKQAMEQKGMGVVEVMTSCHTTFGRRNKITNTVEMMKDKKERAVSLKKAATLDREQLENKIITGVFATAEREEYQSRLEEIRNRAKKIKEKKN